MRSLIPVLCLLMTLALAGCSSSLSLCNDPCDGVQTSDCRDCFGSRKLFGVIETNPNARCAPPAAFGASKPETNIFGQECGLPVYTAKCPDLPFLKKAGDWVNETIFGCEEDKSYALLKYPTPAPVSAAPCASAPVAAAPQGKCGPRPANVKPGEVWCCVWVQPAAAAPVRVCTAPASQKCIPVPAVMGTRSKQVLVSPARTEWQEVECVSPGAQKCYKLTEIPAVYRTETYEVVEKPASVRYETIPAQYAMRASAPPPGFWEWQRKTECEVPAR